MRKLDITGNDFPAPGRADETPRPATGLSRAGIAAALLVFLVTVAMVGKFAHGDYKDAEVWYDAGRRVLSGDTLAGLPHYRYPPTFAVLVAPFAALGFPPFFFLWYALNVGLFGVALRTAGAIVFPPHQAVAARHYWLPGLLVGVFAIDNLFLGQTNILIMSLLYLSFLQDSRGREWHAGLPLGAAIAIKAFPAPLLAYFLFRTRLRLVTAALLTCAFFLFVLPAPARGFQRNLREVVEWGKRVALPYVSRGQAGDWGQHSLDFGNQSLPAVARRYFTYVDAQVMAREAAPIYVNVADLSSQHANLVVLALFAGLCVGFTAACGLRRRRSQLARAVEYAIATVLLLLVSALSWTYFFVMLLLPAVVAMRLLEGRQLLGRVSVWAVRVALWGLVAAT
ncbi:MAG: DUF2029 domain-containing protein, partial [Gemmatimonadales bacterium]|nr:DUF2029 domain-containing protein [Gemmatimonadales bacterium]